MFQRLRKIFGVTGGTQTGTPDEEIIQGLSGPPRDQAGNYLPIRSVGGEISVFFGDSPRPTITAIDCDESLSDQEWQEYVHSESQKFFRERKLQAAKRDGFTGYIDDFDDQDGDDGE